MWYIHTHTHAHTYIYIYMHTYLEDFLNVSEVGWLFGFYVISTFVGHLTPNSVYIHTYSTKDFKTNIKVGRIFY